MEIIDKHVQEAKISFLVAAANVNIKNKKV